MELFRLNGYNGEYIALTLTEALGFPDTTSYEGGYDLICTLNIKMGSYRVECERYFSATGALYRFLDELERCYESLEGTAKYSLMLENDLVFEVVMTRGGHATVNGAFQERPDINNVFSFEMETDQSCFISVIESIKKVRRKYGGTMGVK